MSIIIFLFISAAAPAQKEAVDPKAKAILDELSTKTKAFKTIKATFTITIETKEKKKETQDGSILIKAKKYKVSLKGQEYYNNGTYIWNYVGSAKETTKDFAPKPEDKSKTKKGIDVSKMFTIYEEGYKYRFNKEEVADGVTLQIIDLFPTNPDQQDFHTIKLMIDKNKKQIHSVKFLNKDGSTRLIRINAFTSDSEMADDLFNYEAVPHPGIHLEDMTKD
ncbi:MAG: outer membrane lipoprotein carrier protein LolA [Bacteroidia bacterium]